MVNHRRGEIAANLGGAQRTLCLTLGALAHLESAFGAQSLAELGSRFGGGQLSSNDLITIIHAGLMGGGNDFSREEVADMHVDGGLPEYADIVRRLLEATFGK